MSFKSRLFKAKEETPSTEAKHANEAPETASIWTHKLQVDDEIKQKVIDANVADNERWDIYDPRNPLNKRRANESKHILKDRQKSGGNSSGHHRDK